MKKLLPLSITIILICSTIFGTSILNVMAEEPESPMITRYYKSIMIEEGDSLWSISQTYNTDYYLDTQTYIKELKAMNSLLHDTIHAGQYLTIVYFIPEDL